MSVNFAIKSVYAYPFTWHGFGDSRFTEYLMKLYRAMSATSTRDEYLMWVKQWKIIYKAVGEEIKRNRFEIARYHEWQRSNNKSSANVSSIANRQKEVVRLARYANELILMRQNNKVLARVAADRDFTNV